MTGSSSPRIIAHRGASGVAHENSRAAFTKARELGANAVELDVHATADGVMLVHHDETVSGVGRIPELPAAAFAAHKLPNGETIPTLEEALRLLDGLEVWVEVKTLPERFYARFLALLAEGPTPTGYAVHSFDHRIIARLGEAQPDIRRGVLLASYLVNTPAALNAAGADTLWMETHLIDQALVDLLHEDEFRIIAWTANEPREIERLIALGVDGICGNYPDRIRAALARRGAGH